MRREYELDYTKAERGKYCRHLLAEGANVVVLDDDIAKAFRSSEAVNTALRSLLALSKQVRQLTRRANRTSPQTTSKSRG